MGHICLCPVHANTQFDDNEPAYDVLRNQSSIAKFTHQVLNDLAKFKTGLVDYTKMSEAERAEKFYGVVDASRRERELARIRDELALCNEGDKRRQLELMVLYSVLFDKYAPIFVEHIEKWYREAFLISFTEKMVGRNVTDPLYHLISELHSVGSNDDELKLLPESVNTYFLELLTDYNLLVETSSFTPEKVTDELLKFLGGYKGDFADGRLHTAFLKHVKRLNIGCFAQEESD